ncbi:membrane protein [gut metagenome]|uniref:Membrane protein n=1 Tax=gut metagenome TaxID=749906 RepID=J9GZS4_9ZZZZ
MVKVSNSFSVNVFSELLSAFQILPAPVPTISGVMISIGDVTAVFFIVVFLLVVFLVVVFFLGCCHCNILVKFYNAKIRILNITKKRM